MSNRHKGIYKLILADWLAAALSWGIFFFIRKMRVYHLDFDTAWEQTETKDWLVILLLIPLFWFLLYFFSGTYVNLYKKSRLRTFFVTFAQSIIGSVLLFFLFVLNDPNVDYNYFLDFLYKFFLVHFGLTLIFRFIVLSIAHHQLVKGKVSFQCMIIGSNNKSKKLYDDVTQNPNLPGYHFVGYVDTNPAVPNGLSGIIPQLGEMDDLEKISQSLNLDEIFLAIESTEHHQIKRIITDLSNSTATIKIDADSYDIITGVVKTQNLFMSPYLEVPSMVMTDWERIVKRTLDIILSSMAIALTFPLMLWSAWKVKRSSKGPIIYKQKRLGLHAKEFDIMKFRSMYTDAEMNGPQLSSDNDPRITPWGKVMRKWRIDELPQFFNILKGDMSLVGPRPERKYFYDILSELEPSYKILLKVRPGITSWGMVKYGYAENPDQMLHRLRYDLLYIRNTSLILDFKIIVLTLVVILQGRGK